MSFINEGLFSKITTESIDKLTDEELEKIYSTYSNYNFAAKSEIKGKCYDKLKRGEQITLDAIQFLLVNFEVKDEYFLLIDLILEKIQMLDMFKLAKNWGIVFKTLFEDATVQNDISKFNEVGDNYERTYKKLKGSGFATSFVNPSKEIRKKKLSFYFTNKYYDEYFNLADSLITDYMIPFTPENAKKI